LWNGPTSGNRLSQLKTDWIGLLFFCGQIPERATSVRTDLLWLMVSQGTVHHGREGKADQSSYCGDQEVDTARICL
jgi:hypothetical protein